MSVANVVLLRHNRRKPVGIDLFEAVGRTDLRIALEDAGTVLIDVPADVDSQHLSVETVHEGQDACIPFAFRAVEMED